LQNHKDRMRYDAYRCAGLPLILLCQLNLSS